MFGIRELKPKIAIADTTVECPVLNCHRLVERQRNSFKREERFQCPDHKIFISPSTFEYENEVDNLLWKSREDIDLLGKIKKSKRECRISRDNSEDALSWNVFRYLEISNQLDQLLSWVTNKEQQNSELIYWSYSQKANGAWHSLNKARKEFGENLQRSSEPDLIALTNNGLFFIEAKLTATNNTKPSDSNNRKKYLVGGNEWYRQVFRNDFETIAISSEKYELFRFWLLGSWLASEIGKDFYLINVVLSEREKDIETRFIPHIYTKINRQFIRITWEEINNFILVNAPENDNKRKVVDYFSNKTIGYNRFGELQKAFILE